MPPGAGAMRALTYASPLEARGLADSTGAHLAKGGLRNPDPSAYPAGALQVAQTVGAGEVEAGALDTTLLGKRPLSAWIKRPGSQRPRPISALARWVAWRHTPHDE